MIQAKCYNKSCRIRCNKYSVVGKSGVTEIEKIERIVAPDLLIFANRLLLKLKRFGECDFSWTTTQSFLNRIATTVNTIMYDTLRIGSVISHTNRHFHLVPENKQKLQLMN